jgi:hypothetical protein
MRKWIAIAFVLLLLAVIIVLYHLNQRRAVPVIVTFLGYTNAPAGSRMGFFGAVHPIDVPAGSRVGLFGITNIGSATVARWSTCAVEIRGLGMTNIWLDSVASLQPGQGECLQVPLPATKSGWRVILHSTHGWKYWWNDVFIHWRFVPRAQPDQTFSNWVEE